MPFFWHILIFCVTVLFSKAVSIPQNGHVCYVLPRGTSNSSCPYDGNPCLDINTYVLSSSRYFISNTTFIFLPGIHFFDVEELFNIENVDMLFLIGNSSFTQSSVADDSVTYNFRQYNDDSIVTYLESLTNIKCSGKSGFSFSNVTNLQLINLTIINCGIYSSQTSLNASIHLANISSLMIEGVTIKNSTGYGLLGVNVLGHSSIIRSSFIGNNQFVKSIFRATNITNKCNNEQFNSTRYISNDLTSCSINGGNVYLKFEYSDPNLLGGNELLLSYIVLSLGVDGYYPYCSTPTPGTGLALVIHNHVHVTINNTVSYRNQGQFGANFYFETISGSNITIHNVTSKSGVSSNGSLYFYILSSSALQNNTSQLMIKNSILACNYAEEYGGSIHINIPEDSVHFIYMYIYLQNSTIVDDISSNKPNTFLFIKTGIENTYISVTNCYFKNFNSNSGLYERFEIVGKSNDLLHVHVQLLMDSSYFMYTDLSCELVDVYITNSNFNYSRATAIRSSIILNEKVFFSNVLTYRIGGALLLVSSLLVIKEHAVVIFANNIATNGGALFIDQQSSVLFFSSSNVSFINNVATLAGGAIYVQSGIPSPFIRSKCFFQFNVTYGLEFDVHIYFEGNYAGDAGSVLYGGNIDHCTLDCSHVPHQYHNICIKSSGKIFNMTMDIGPHDNTMSLISSDPTTVCYCNQGYPLTCSHPDHKNVMVYPGEKVNKSLITLGQRSGITPGIVYAWYISLDLKNVSIASTFRTSSRCEGYDISIKNLNINNTIILYLTTQESFNSATDIMHKIEFGITILPCPIGFSIENTTSLSCDCNTLLHSHGLTCNISTQYFSWSSGAKWIGNISHNVIGIIDDCPSNYCNSLTTVTLQNSDKQCKYNRSGILCGQCKDNLSMMFGSSQCGSECKNHHLLLLIPFAIMGVALVGFLLVFNFTVTNGTINSFILYAFITGLNENIYLPSSCYKFLYTFIFWLNIDLGIETCFYEYMDSIGKVWLQFLFSIYVSGIIGVIIMAGRISSKISRLCRYRIVPVIATLILLFYSKMLRTVMMIFSFTRMDISDAHSQFVWTYDGNVLFLSPKHIGLFIAGLLITIFFIIPYTILLLLTPYLIKVSHWRIFSWINRIKPLVDSYEAPYKDQYRFWTGAMLIYRITLVIMSAYFSQQPTMILLVIIVVHAGIVFSGFAIYKSWIISATETVLNVNIIITSLAVYFSTPESNNCIPTALGVIVALLCLCVVLLHNILKAILQRIMLKIGRLDYSAVNSERSTIHQSLSYENIRHTNEEYREPLMDDN